jgi:hypothetical protein
MFDTPSDFDYHFTDMSARVKILERFTGIFEVKHLVNDGFEINLLLIQKLAKVLMILLCSYRNTSVSFALANAPKGFEQHALDLLHMSTLHHNLHSQIWHLLWRTAEEADERNYTKPLQSFETLFHGCCAYVVDENIHTFSLCKV